MKKNKAKFNSLSTPGVKQDLSNYLVELAFLRSNRGVKMPPKFWQNPQHKFRYMREIKGVRKFIKDYGESIVLEIALAEYITTWTKYDILHVLAQHRVAARERMKMPKDLTPVVKLDEQPGTDLRGRVNRRPRKKGLFEMIEELEDVSKNQTT